MALQLSDAAATGILATITSQTGGAAHFKIYSGAVPANTSAADPAGLLVDITMPALPFGPIAGRTMDVGTLWSGTASGTGTALSWRIKNGGTCVAQGTCSGLAGTGDLKLTTTSINVSDTINIPTFTLTAGNA